MKRGLLLGALIPLLLSFLLLPQMVSANGPLTPDEIIKNLRPPPLPIPRNEWPPIPSETQPDLARTGGLIAPDAESPYKFAGIYTVQETYSGFEVAIYGGDIANDDPINKDVRLTPHLVPTGTDDYLAFVLEKEAEAGQLRRLDD